MIRQSRTRVFDSGGRHRPEWGFAEKIGWVLLASALVLGVAAGSALLNAFGVWLGIGDNDTVIWLALFVLLVAAVLAAAAAWWLGDTGAILIILPGLVLLSAMGALGVTDGVLTAEGRPVVATVSKMDAQADKSAVNYTYWLTDPQGRPIPQPLETRARTAPWCMCDKVTVVADPRVTTKTPEDAHEALVPAGGGARRGARGRRADGRR